MNYDLAMMALEGLSRAPLEVKHSGEGIEIYGPAAGFKELARLCLLLGSEGVAVGESFELKPPIHLKGGSSSIVLRKDE